jgi:hypothetical protein
MTNLGRSTCMDRGPKVSTSTLATVLASLVHFFFEIFEAIYLKKSRKSCLRDMVYQHNSALFLHHAPLELRQLL